MDGINGRWRCSQCSGNAIIASGARWLVNIQAWHRPAAVRKST